eukprot:4724124-Ditylum_brightwellii.AAC.1
MSFVETFIPYWHTQLHLRHEAGIISTGDILISCGIFQGDSLSPLIFCIALFPLNNILYRAGTGLTIKWHGISHLLYIDDLK